MLVDGEAVLSNRSISGQTNREFEHSSRKRKDALLAITTITIIICSNTNGRELADFYTTTRHGHFGHKNVANIDITQAQ